MFGVLVFLAIATCLNVPVVCDEVMWPDGKVRVDVPLLIRYEHEDIFARILADLQYFESVSCVQFLISIDNPPTNDYYFSFQFDTHSYVETAPKSCGTQCERKIAFDKDDELYRGRFKRGISAQLGVDIQTMSLSHDNIKQLNEIYKCSDKCVFLPKCKNGGYASPQGPKGCGTCVCPPGKTCQDEKVVAPNNEHDMMKAGSTALFTESIKETVTEMFDDVVSDTSKGAIGAGAGVALMDLLTGEEENIPEDVTAAVAESLICSKLEKVFEKVATGSAIAAGTAAAAVGVVQDLARGDVAGAIKTGISKGLGNYIGSAIGSIIGSAIGGPFGTIIGAVLGAIIGEAVSWLIREILDFLTPYFEVAWEWIKGNWQAFIPGVVPPLTPEQIKKWM